MKSFAPLLLACSMTTTACWSWAAEPASQTAWLTGQQLEAQFDQPVKLAWTGVPLSRAIGDLARLNRVALLLDRRVDPGQPIDLAVSDEPLADVLDGIADRAGIGFTRVGPLGYFGPTSTTSRLRTIVALRHDEAVRLPNAAPAPWLHAAVLAWDDLATPRDLVAGLAREAKIELRGLDLVPHDLWAAARLPSMSLVDRLTIITAEFDLTFRFENAGRGAELVPWPEDPVIERSYPGGSRPADTVDRWRTIAPRAVFQIAGSKVTVRARLEDQDSIVASRRTPTSAKPKSKAPRVDSYTLKLDEVPLEQVLRVLEQKLKIQFDVDREAVSRAGIRLDRNISLRVEQVTLDQLLEAALQPAGLKFTRDGTHIKVSPAGK